MGDVISRAEQQHEQEQKHLQEQEHIVDGLEYDNAIVENESESSDDKKDYDHESSFVTSGSNELLLKFINSAHFTIYHNIEYLTRYSGNIGIHYYLCQKLLAFPHIELQFYIPQLVQVLLTVETESMALEDLLLKLSKENPHFALLTYWQLHALLSDLSTDPESYSFHIARRVINKLQMVLCSSTTMVTQEPKINENLAPSVVLCSMILGSVALPTIGYHIKPLVESQGKRQRSHVFKLAKNAMKSLTKSLSPRGNQESHSSDSRISSLNETNNANGTPNFIQESGFNRRSLVPTVDIVDSTNTKEDALFKKPKERSITALDFDMVENIGEQLLEDRLSNSIILPKRRQKHNAISANHLKNPMLRTMFSSHDEYSNSMPNLNSGSSLSSKVGDPIQRKSFDNPKFQNSTNAIGCSGTMPKASLSSKDSFSKDTKPQRKPQGQKGSRSGVTPYNVELSNLTTTQKIKILKANYFRCEMQFAIALETISRKLAQVPPEARLTSLRAELSIMNRDLPAKVDIPTLLPQNKKGKLHRIVNIVANEAQVLNSAEKVPFLLYIEYLRDDMDFDPTAEVNDNLLREKPDDSGFIFDLTYVDSNDNQVVLDGMDDNSDESNLNYDKTHDGTGNEGNYTDNNSKNINNNNTSNTSTLFLRATSETDTQSTKREIDLGDLSMVKMKNQNEADIYRCELLIHSAERVPAIPSNSNSRTSELSFVTNFDAMTEKLISTELIPSPDISEDLATQMRISAMMLAQLDKSPQQLSDTTNQIRAKIIASMQEVQDRFGYYDLHAVHGMAGERKLENDLKTGGLSTTDKKTMTYLGEDWTTKKEKIRSASQYGHLENWDLCSVIAKSGDDLRQEAFACQLIQAMANIWNKEKVDIWVKRMKILITSANTGLVETITNALSIHSIKKALTKQMIENGELNEKGSMSTLVDHFVRAFGDPTSFRYKRAQANFASSLAAYSLICYILQIKDRHNGNIMIDNEGHLVHIDFGFMLSNSPGSVGFEAAPFKLTQEYVDLLGGIESEPYKKFVRLTKEAFKALRKYADLFTSMCEVMQKDNLQPCFNAGDQTSVQLRQRFHTDLTDEECDDFVENVLIAKSLGSIYTRLYDQFQLMTQGICT